MSWKFDIVFGYNEVQPWSWVINLSDLYNLHIVSNNIISKLERRNINNINIRVFHAEYSSNLSVLSLQKLLHRHSFHFSNANRVYMNLNTLLLFNNTRPFFFKLLLSLSPNKESLIIFLFNSSFRQTYIFIQSKLSLNYGSICSQIFKMLKFMILLKHPKSFLYHNRCVLVTFRSSKHSLGEFNLIC